MKHNELSRLSNDDLITQTKTAAAEERLVTARLVALLSEVDSRRLYLGQGCASLFVWCTSVLRLSEHAAYHRIEAARAGREYPVVLERLEEGTITLTAVGLLRPHLTPENHLSLLDAARHRSKREVERMIAAIAPRPGARPLVRRLPAVKQLSAAPAVSQRTSAVSPGAQPPATSTADTSAGPSAQPSFALCADLPRSRSGPASAAAPAEDRFLLRVTIGRETNAKLDRARDLLRHSIPSGDPSAIIDRALSLLVAELERTKLAATPKPRTARGARTTTRHIAAAVKRAIWARDGGRCTFVGAAGRCAETGRLEFHHTHPFACGGPTDASNLTLRCRAHNAFEARLVFGERALAAQESRSGSSARSGPSSEPRSG